MSTAISWSSKAPFKHRPTEEPSQWRIIKRKSTLTNIEHKTKQSHLNTATGSVSVRGNKQKAESDEQCNVLTAKKLKPNNAEVVEDLLGPMGLVWDHQNWSCAYDSYVTFLYYVWIINPHK